MVLYLDRLGSFTSSSLQEEALLPHSHSLVLCFSILLTQSETAFGSHLFPGYTHPLPLLFFKKKKKYHIYLLFSSFDHLSFPSYQIP